MKKWEEPKLVNLCVEETNLDEKCDGVNCLYGYSSPIYEIDTTTTRCKHYNESYSNNCSYNPNPIPGQDS